jgi:hypothetical protein
MSIVGILYDNWSGNTGDQAIGISIKQILDELKIDYEEIDTTNFCKEKYVTIIVGGGLLIGRSEIDHMYNIYKVPGNNILNTMGIHDDPTPLEYLNEYEYVSVRSEGDRQRIHYLKTPVYIMPCPTMLLQDLKDFSIYPKAPSICFHLLPWVFQENKQEFIEWAKTLPYNIYFLPVTHYCDDKTYMDSLCAHIPNAVCYPNMKPLEIFTLLGRFTYVVACSLHCAIFSYVHKVPFLLLDNPYDRKMEFFMKDRGLETYLFKDLIAAQKGIASLEREAPDYTTILEKDFSALCEHKARLKVSIEKIIDKSKMQ